MTADPTSGTVSSSRSPAPARSPRHDRTTRLTDELFRRAASLEDERERLRVLDEIVLLNQEVALSLASRYSGRGVDHEDLCQVALEALTKAVRRFEPARNKHLLAYAVPTIRGEIQRYFRDLGWMVRPTRAVQENQQRISRTRSELAQDLGRSPTHHEAQGASGLRDQEFAAAATAAGCFRPASLDQPSGADGDTTLGDLLPDDSTHPLAEVEARLTVWPLLRELSDRDRRILFMRYFEERSQSEIGNTIGITQSQVSRRLNELLAGLRAQLVDSA